MQYEAEARGHKVICDQPVEAGGTDEGMTPTEFLSASLGTCAMFYAAYYLRLHHLPADGMTVQVEADKASKPARMGAFRLVIEVPGLTDEVHREGVRRAAEKCMVKNTLLMPPEMVLTVR